MRSIAAALIMFGLTTATAEFSDSTRCVTATWPWSEDGTRFTGFDIGTVDMTRSEPDGVSAEHNRKRVAT